MAPSVADYCNGPSREDLKTGFERITSKADYFGPNLTSSLTSN